MTGEVCENRGPHKIAHFVGRGSTAARMSFCVYTEARDAKHVLTRAGQGTENAVYVAAGVSAGTGTGYVVQTNTTTFKSCDLCLCPAACCRTETGFA